MKYSNTIEYNISTKLDNSGLTKLQAQLKQVENSMQQMANKKWLNPSQVIESREQLSKLGEALNKSYNSSLGMLDFSKLRTELTNTGVSAEKLQTAFRLSGVEGQNALASLAKELVNFNAGIEKSSSSIDKIFTTFSNTFRWGVVSSFFSQFMNAIHSSVDYVKELDDSLTQIMLVTDYNRDSMNEYAKSANEAAKALSMSTTGMTNASLVFAQQGYDLNQSQELATLSAKLANASQQDTATTSDQITAYMNAYGLEDSIGELTQAMDNWALIANVSAADVSELAQASQRAASMANAVGVSGEQLASQIATIESVTREAPEQIGNGLKTLYARFSDIAAGKEDEDGFTLGKVTSELNKIGVQVLDEMGQIRDVGDIMEDLMVIWDDLDQTSKTAAAQALAGKYQVNRFEALMENSDMYREYKGATGENAAGTLDQMNQEYVESLAGRTQKLQTTLEGLFNDVFTTDMVYPVIDSLTKLADAIDLLFKSVGGGPNIILGLATAFGQLFQKNLAHNINNWIDNAQITEKRQRNVEEFGDTMRAVGLDKSVYGDKFKQIEELAGKGIFNNKEDYEALTQYMYDYIDSTAAVEAANKKLEESYLSLSTIFSSLTNDEDNIFKTDENGKKEFNIENALTNLQGLSEADWDRFKSIDWDQSKKGVSELTKSISNLQSQFTLMNDDNYDLLKPKILDSLEKAYDDLSILQEQTLISKETFEDFSKVLDSAFDALDENGEIDEAKVNIEELASVIAVLAKNIHEIDPDTLNKARLGKDAKDLAGKETDLTSLLESKQLRSEADLDDFIASKEKEIDTNKILQFTDALGKLTFSWQAFQNLGSIWNDKDLSLTEKLTQTFVNLSIIIPSIVSAFKGLKEGTAIIKALGAAEEILAAKSAMTSVANAGFSLSNIAVSTSAGIAATALGVLKAAFIKLQAAIPVIGPALAILSVGLGAFALNTKNYAEELANEADSAIEEYDKLNQKVNVDTSNFDKAYETYQKTGVASDELKNAASSLSDQLDIAGGEALIASGKFDTLAESIKNTKDEADAESIEALSRMYNRIDAEKSNDSFFDRDDWASRAKRVDNRYNNTDLGNEDASIIEKIGGLTKIKETVDQKISNLEEEEERLENLSEKARKNYRDKLGRNYQQALDSTKAFLKDANKDKQDVAELFDEDIEKIISTSQDQAKKLIEKTDFSKFKSKEDAQQQLTDLDGEYAAIARQWVILGGKSGSETAQKYLDSLLVGLEEGKEPVNQLLQDMMNPEVSADALTSAKEAKDPLEELYSKYDKNEGSFSEDEVADILKDHAEYIEYLDKEGEHYVLNRRFLEDYNQAVRDQKQAMDELQGDSFDLRDNQDFLNDKLDNEEDPNQAIYQKLAEANYGMMQGGLTSDGFLDATNEALDELVDRLSEIPEYGEAAAKGMDAFAEVLSELDADAIGAVFDELYGGLKQSAKQFKSGQKTVGQYGEDLLQATETAMDFAEVTGDTQSVEKFQDILDDGAEGAVEFSNAITDNYDQITQVFDNNFNVLDSAMSEVGGVAEQYRGVIEQLVTSSANFYSQNEEAASAMAAALYADLSDVGYSVNDLRTMLQTGSADLVNALMNDASATETFTKGTTSRTQAAISQMASGISSLISGTMQVIAGVSGNINGEPEITAGKTVDVDAVDSTGNKSKVSMHIPGFNMVIKGNGSAGSGGAGGKTFWSPSANNGSGGFVTKFSRDMTTSGHAETRAATTEEIISSGALSDWSNQVAGDLAGGITGIVTADQYAPPTSSGGAAPVRGGSGGGGGGKGKSCFVAGTLVSTSFGFRPIEQIQKGDIVLSYNKSLGLNEYSEVLQTMIHDTIEPIYTLYIKNEQLRVTGIHRFLVTDKITCGVPQWIHAADLKVGQWVLFADGTWHVIHKIEVNTEHQTVYNFEVSGNHNYYVGHNQILAHNKGGGGGKGKKGGGGGGKAKTIEPKEKKEHEKDYYEEVNTQLDKTEKILSKIEKEEDRLIGDKARANQNKQLSLLKKEIDLNKEKQKIQQQELKDVDKLMKKRVKEARELVAKNGITAIIPSPIYDKDGAIANYEEMSAAIDKIHNQFIDQYNAAAKAGNEELTKEIQKTLEKFDKYGEDLLKNAQRHDKLQSEIEETINTLEELEDSIEDIRIDAFKAHQEAQDDLKDLKEDAAELASIFRDFNDDGFLTDWSLDDTPIDDMIKAMYELDDIYSVTQEDANKFYQDLIDKKEEALKNTTDKDEIAAIQSAIQYFQEQQANLGPDNLQNGLLGLANQDLDKLKGWIDGTNTEFNPFGKNTAALWEAYEDAYKRATDLFKDWRETVQDLRDSIIDTYDEQEDAINNNIDEYDRLLDHLERINDTYTLYYGEDSYDNILTIMDRQGATMQQQLNDLTTAFKYWEQRYQEAIANGDEKLIQEIKEKMEDAEDAMYDKAEELAEHWVDRYEKAVDASIQKIDIKLWGGGPGQTDLEDQSTIWELQKDYMNTYKDDVEKAYEIDKLRSKYIDLLNDAQGMSLGTQNRIRKQMEDQLKLLENQNTVSEYDVKLANAKLEVLQKQMALEDAQRNKNKMQLRRDTQGNYRYVYRADEGNVKQAQDELAESEFDAYEMTKEQTIANNDRAISLYQDYMNKMRDIANKYQDDEVARNAALLALKEEYGKLLGALGEDFQNTTDGMYDVLTWLVKNGTEDTTTAAKDMMDQLYENAHKVKENTGNDWRDLATQITKDVLPNIQTAVEQGIGDIDTEATNLSKNLVGDNGVLNKIKSSTKMLEQGMMDATDTTEKWAKATRDLFESFSPDNKKVQEAMTQLKQMEEQLSANQQATSALSTKYKQANAALQSKTAEAEHYKTALDFSTGAKQVKTGTVVKLKKGTAVHYSRNNSQTDKQGHYGWSLPYDMWVKFGEIDKGQANPYSFYATGDSLKQFGPIQNNDKSDNRGGEADTDKRHHQPWWFDQSELQKNVLAAMDTGGYTGSWNDNTSLYKNGKIAMLHQKELVLNATDTQNILTAVSLMRDMIAGSTNGLFNMNGLSNNISSSYNPVTEQRVEIQASFPNATDADDIRRALINLSDNAYQYSYRTR